MDNYGIDLKTWESLNKRWSELEAAGHKLEIEFQLITDPKDKEHVLAIDVIQHIDDHVVTETVQRSAGEAYATLGIRGLSMEHLVTAYKDMLQQLLHEHVGWTNINLVVTMSPSSETSGEVYAHLEKPDGKSSVVVNYRHYYLLNALRERMIEMLGDHWKKVRAVFSSDSLEFYFDY